MRLRRLIPPAHFADARAGGVVDGLLSDYYAALWREWGPWSRGVVSTVNAFRGGISVVGGERRALGLCAAEYRMVMARIPDAGERRRYVPAPMRGGINILLNPAALPLCANRLKDKARFAEICHAAMLPMPPTLAEPTAPEAILRFIADARALIVKPSHGSCGRGIHRVDCIGNDWRVLGRRLPTDRVVALLGAGLRGGAVIQHHVETHPAMAECSPDALPTLRVLTCLNEQEEVEVVGTMLRMGGGGAAVDNLNAGGLIASVGGDHRLSAALSKGSRSPEHRHHPRTGAPIEGRAAPHIAEALDMARRGHETLRDGFTLIGWDIGLGINGPVAIEANWNPGLEGMQFLAGRSIDTMRLGALYRWHLSRLTPEQWRRALPTEYHGRPLAPWIRRQVMRRLPMPVPLSEGTLPDAAVNMASS